MNQYPEIETVVARLLEALRRQDATACAMIYTDDGLILSPYGLPARGHDQIKAVHQVWFDEGETNKLLELLDAHSSGDLGYCLLAYAGDYAQPDGSLTTHSGKSVNVLRRQPDGQWRISISSLTADSDGS